MTDIKFKILFFSAALLIFVSAIIPASFLLCDFRAPLAPSIAAPDKAVANLEPIGGYEKEMRALWIATVNNINFPSKAGLSESELKSELDAIVDFSYSNGFNAIMFQVRPSADALYKSDIFPASKFVSGESGVMPNGDFDCLRYIVNAAHEKGIALHAWVNPLRVTTGTDISALEKSSPAAKHPEYTVAYSDGKLYFDVGIPDVRELVALGVREICEGYEVDGIIFDDYFYPYPHLGKDFEDSETFETYGGGFESVADFRRESVNSLIKLCYDTVKEVNGDISFGVSPFGIWQNFDGTNGGSLTNGLSAYSEIYCDALAWANGGYVDYLAPQIYWSFENANAPFDTLAEWWSRALDGTGVKLYINYGVYKYDEGEMKSGEIEKQVAFSRSLYSYRGGMYYGYAALEKNSNGVLDEVRKIFADSIAYFDYYSDGTLTLESYGDGDLSGESALICGMSNLAYPISVNGITPLRYKDGRYAITLKLMKGDNLITVINGEEKIEIVLKY